MRKLAWLILAINCMAQTAKFPAAVATDADLLVAYNRGVSSLANPMDDTTLTLTVTNAAAFNGYANFEVTIENERILVCSASGATLTVCTGGRGFDGSVAAAHVAAKSVDARSVAWHHNALSKEIQAIQTALGVNLGNVEKPLTFSLPLSRTDNAISCSTCVKTDGSYSDPSWLTLTKSKVGLGNVENTALSTWAGSGAITTVGTLATGSIPGTLISSAVPTATALAADPTDCSAGSAAGGIGANGNAAGCIVVNVRQINFSIYDPSTAIAAATIASVWRNELASNATLANVYCESDTGDAVINFQKDDGSPANVLSGNLTCLAAGASSTSWTAGENVMASGDRLDWVVVSGTAKRINVSIKYTY